MRSLVEKFPQNHIFNILNCGYKSHVVIKLCIQQIPKQISCSKTAYTQERWHKHMREKTMKAEWMDITGETLGVWSKFTVDFF